jgi:Ca2+-binding RTX toxin-like protein
VIEDFEAGDNLELSASTGSYWIGAAPGNGFSLSFNNNVPLLGYLQTPDTSRFGIYTAGTPNLVAIVNLAGGLELDRLSLELAFEPIAPDSDGRYKAPTGSLAAGYLGYGTFWKLEGSSFSKYVNQAYTMEDSYASLETLVRSGDDTFTGGLLADYYNGYGANDSLLGGGGNDTLLGDSGNDSLFGEAGNDSLLGGKGSDYIDGGVGDDQMIGGTGDDTFVVDALTDAVTEQANEGTDLVIASVSGYALTANANLENLTLTGPAINGSGNALDNRLTGNAENNTLAGLAGDDTLDGGVGTDTLQGGANDDTYIVDNTNDTIEDSSGTDTVRTSASFDLSDTKVAGGTGIEHLLYTGTTTGVSLTGNINANSITGAAGSDTLDGKDGLNTLIGGAGNDFYVLAVNDDDKIVDTSGTDTALAIGTLSLATLSGGSSIENIQLTAGSGTLTGNSLANTITGFTGADYLVGGTANDSLSGGGGNDTLVGSSSSARGAREVDTLTGNAGIDIFVLGDSSSVYYDADGESDYAIITDFVKGTDLLQLNGVAGDYAFGSLTGGYYDLTYTAELIAKVKGSVLVTGDIASISNFV